MPEPFHISDGHSGPDRDGTRYTVLVLDIASGSVNALYHDIPGNDLSEESVESKNIAVGFNL